MRQLRSIESTITYNEKLINHPESSDPFVEYLRSILPREHDHIWEGV